MMPFDPTRDRGASEFANHIHNLCFMEAASEGWLDENLDGVEEKDKVKKYLGKRVDWIGVNYYTRNVIRWRKSILAKVFAGVPYMPRTVSGYGNSCKPNSLSAAGRPTSDLGWELYPEGLTESLKIMPKYGKPILITENGVADSADKLRPKFIVGHFRELDGCASD
ncbi:MAG: family 1 glycosylhydrolase [Nitrososphaeria archaeon]